MADPNVLAALLHTANRLGASPKERKALIEAGIVESGLQNLNYGDKDSLGVLQERTSIYGRSHALNPRASAARFLRQARQLNRPGMSAGELAQAAQRSAFPERYDQHSSEAESLLGSNASAARGGRASRGRPGRVQGKVTAGSTSGAGFDPGESSPLLGALLQNAPPPLPTPVVQAPNSAQRYLSGGGSPVQVNPVQPQQSGVEGLLAAIQNAPQDIPDAITSPGSASVKVTGSPRAQTSSGGGTNALSSNLVRSVQTLDSLAGRRGVPITAKQEPGHATGGDHDPAVRGATARDFGGSEPQRQALFNQITRRLGVRNAVYKGQDINVVKNGIRYQIISRDHGTGPHLHVGLRRVAR